MFAYIKKCELVKQLKSDDFVSCMLPYFSKKAESKFSSFTIYTYFLVKLLNSFSATIIILTKVQFSSVEELEIKKK